MAAHIVAQSGKSMTSKTGAAIGSKVQSSITRRQVGKKEQRPSNGEDNDDEAGQPWRAAQRPAGALPVQDNSFCVEDETTSSSVESIMYAFSVSDPQQSKNPLVYVSPGFETLSGYSSEEVLGNNCKLLQGKNPDKDKVSVLRSGMEGRSFTSCQLTNYRRDGKAFQNLLCIVPFLDAYDNLLKFIGVQCDLDDKRRRETVDELFISKWQEQVKHYLTAFMLTDNSHDSSPIIAVSLGFTNLTGYTQTDVIGCGCLCLAGPDTNQKQMKKLVTAQRADKAAAVKLLCYRQDGAPFWAYWFSFPLTAGRGSSARHTLNILVDITTSRLKRVGKYILGKVIGSGAYGIVRVGKIPGTDEIVAIKSVDATKFRSISEIEQIQEEMNVLSSLKHPNIIRLIEIHFMNSVFFMIMEFASGGSLVKHMQRFEGAKLPEKEAQRVFQQMAHALEYCHRRRVIHRDLKPENILMDDKANIKIADFGLAAVSAPFGRNLTQQCGTPEFTAPEITTGKEYDGPSVDIWSLGVILYEALTGVLPFRGSTTAALFKAIQRGTYEPLPTHLSQSVRDLVKGMLTVDPVARLTMEDILRHPWCRGGDAGGIHQEDDIASALRVAARHAAETESGPASPAGRSHTGFGHSSHLGSHARPSTEGGDTGDIDATECRTSQSSAMARGVSGDLDDTDTDPHSSGGHLGRSGSSKRASASGTSAGMHDSVRLVIDKDHDKDDPITAAIMRAQMATMSILGPPSGGSSQSMAANARAAAAEGASSHLNGHDDDPLMSSLRATSVTAGKAGSAGAANKGREMTPTRFVRGHETSTAATASPSARAALANGIRKAAATADKPGAGSLPPLLGNSGGLIDKSAKGGPSSGAKVESAKEEAGKGSRPAAGPNSTGGAGAAASKTAGKALPPINRIGSNPTIAKAGKG